MIARASVSGIPLLEALHYPDRFGQGDQVLQIEFRIEPQAEQFWGLAVGDRFGQQVTQALYAFVHTDLRKGRGVQCSAQQCHHLAPETVGFDPDFQRAMMVLEPLGQQSERRGQSPSLPIGRPGPGDCQLRQSGSSLKVCRSIGHCQILGGRTRQKERNRCPTNSVRRNWN